MPNLVLVGFSCSGKTTAGRTLARRLRRDFVDTDRLIEESARLSIPEIFEQDGEAGFRTRERAVITQVAQQPNLVISTGGGAFVDPANRELLRAGNFVVHLQVRPETVLTRLRASRTGRPRPLLNTASPLERIRELMNARKDAYCQAHVTLSVDDRQQHEVVAEISRRWQAWQRAHSGRRPASASPQGSVPVH